MVPYQRRPRWLRYGSGGPEERWGVSTFLPPPFLNVVRFSFPGLQLTEQQSSSIASNDSDNAAHWGIIETLPLQVRFDMVSILARKRGCRLVATRSSSDDGSTVLLGLATPNSKLGLKSWKPLVQDRSWGTSTVRSFNKSSVLALSLIHI